MLPDDAEKKSEVQKQKKRPAATKTTPMGAQRAERTNSNKASTLHHHHHYAFSYQCGFCGAFHKGVVESDTDQLQIECLQPLGPLSPSDEKFLIWVTGSQQGITLLCNHVSYAKGRKVTTTHEEEEGQHRLYDGRYEYETIKFLEDRAAATRRSR